MQIELVRMQEFSAALRLPDSPNAKERRLHGHMFSVQLLLAGPLDPKHGWLIDFGEIRSAFAPLSEQLDHSYLNQIEGLGSPTCDVLSQWIEARLKPVLPALARVVVAIGGEDCFAPRRLPPDPALELPERLALSLESAHYLPCVAPGHKCRRLHGHSFLVEVAAGDLDSLPALLQPIYDQLDHRLLNEVEGLDNPTSENLAVWIWRRLQPDAPTLRAIVVRESAASACIFRGRFYPPDSYSSAQPARIPKENCHV